MADIDEHERFQGAIYERYLHGTTFKELQDKFQISDTRLRRMYKQWTSNPLSRQPCQPSDIDIVMPKRGRTFSLDKETESIITNALMYYADNHTPLSKQGCPDLVEHYLKLSPVVERASSFKYGRPSKSWVRIFIERNKLSYSSVRVMEESRVGAVTKEYCAEHLAQVRSVMKRYMIRDARFVFNLDQMGSSFHTMVGRSLRKGIGKKGAALVRKAVRTKGVLQRVTVMTVVSAAGNAMKPVVVYPGKQAHYRIVKGVVQTVQSFLPPCYFHQRPKPGVDSSIMYNWTKGFVMETRNLRQGNQKLLLLLDGYGSHIQFRFLNELGENGIIVIALPAHTSHVLQPLDVSVFSSFKSNLEREIHSIASCKSVLNVFDVAVALFASYFACLSVRNIQDGFIRTGIWNPETLDVDISALDHLFLDNGRASLESLLKSFSKKVRSLVHDADVDREGTIKISTSSGAHLTNDVIMKALEDRDKKRKAKRDDPESVLTAEEYFERKLRRIQASKTRKHSRARAAARSLGSALINLGKVPCDG